VRLTTSVADAKATEFLPDEEPEAEGDRLELLVKLQKEMEKAAQLLDFEKAAKYRDRIRELRQQIDDDEWKAARKRKLKRR
jgi:excinuclease UvrABC nuclease subunit